MVSDALQLTTFEGNAYKLLFTIIMEDNTLKHLLSNGILSWLELLVLITW